MDDNGNGGLYRPHDPYKAARAEANAEAAGKANVPGAKNDALGVLSAAEAGAAKTQPSGIDPEGGLYKNEANPGGFRNNVQGMKNTAQDMSKLATGGAAAKLSAAKNLLKNKGPFGIILIIVAVIGVGILSSQSLLPFSFVARTIDEYNGLSFTNQHRYNNILTRALSKRETKAYNTAVEAFKKQGITVETDGSSTRMTWQTPDGETKSITARGRELKNTIDGLMDTDVNFRNKYTTAVSAWRGKGSSWFDGVTTSVLNRFGLTRNRWQSWDSSQEADVDTKMEQLKEGARRQDGDDTEVGTLDDSDDGDGTDEDHDGSSSEPTSDFDANAEDMSNPDTVRSRLMDIANKVGPGAGLIDTAVGTTCGAVKLYTAANLLVYAHQLMEALNVFSGLVEAVDKTKAGDGANSPINEYSIALTQPDENGKTAMSSSGMAVFYNGGQNKNYANTASVQLVNSENAFSDSLGMPALAGATTTQSFATCAYAQLASSSAELVLGVLSFGTTKLIEVFFGFVSSFFLDTFIQVGLEALTTYIVSVFTTDVVGKMAGEILGDILAKAAAIYLFKNHQASGGSPGSMTALRKFNAAKQEAIAEEAAFDRATLSPFDTSSPYTFLGSIMNSLATFSTTSTGNALTGTVTAVSTTLSNSVSSLLPSASALATTRLNQTVGSCPLLESVGAVGDMYCNPYYVDDFSTIDTDINEVIRKVASFGSFEGYNENITDEEIQQYLDGELELKIIEDSNLYRFIVYCGGRDSIYGVADGNIAAELTSTTGNSTLDSIIGAIPFLDDATSALTAAKEIANVGWVGGGNCIDTGSDQWENEFKWYQRFTEDSRLMENMGFFDSSSTAAIEVDQDRAESEVIAYDPEETYDANGNIIARDADGNLVTEENSTQGLSAVSKAMLAYYEENPIDNSYLGQLSRISGMTEDTIIAVLDETEEYLARLEYDPTGRAPAEIPAQQELTASTLSGQFADSQPTDAAAQPYAVAPKYIAYEITEQTTSA